jgi:hypothetical protein
MSFARQSSPTFRSLLQALVHRCRRPLRQGVRQSRADHYVKQYKSVDFALALVSYFLLGLKSVRELHRRLEVDRHLRRVISLGGISNAQLPKLLHARPSELWGPLLATLVSQVPGERLPRRLRVMDATFFHLGLHLLARRYETLTDPTSAGIKLGLVLDGQTGAPGHCVTSVGKGSDAGQTEGLVPPEEPIAGAIYVFDRGFRKYRFFQRLIDSDADFVTRESRNNHYEVLATVPLDPAAPEIVADEIIRLGSANGNNRMRNGVRRIVKQTDQGPVVFLTSLLDLSATEVADLYRWRWDIEVFFRWLKRTIGCRRPLGYSQRAAEHTIFAALVAYLIVLLLSEAALGPTTGRPTRRIAAATHRLRAVLYDTPLRADLRCLGFR